MARVFYRIVQAERPTEDDFTSNYAKGRPPRAMERENPEVHRSISVFARREEALAVQQTYPKLGSWIAEIELADAEPEIVVRGPGPHSRSSHHGLEGTAAAFLRRVREVRAV